jgi:membrane-bound ClpP family serine protease
MTASLIGQMGQVILATRGKEGPGEVSVNGEVFFAWSAEPISRGVKVLVLDSTDHRTVTVQPL